MAQLNAALCFAATVRKKNNPYPRLVRKQYMNCENNNIIFTISYPGIPDITLLIILNFQAKTFTFPGKN